MNDGRDEANRLRIRDDSLADGFSRTARDPAIGMPCLVAKTTTIATYPTTAQVFFACTPLTVLGPEVEGSAGTTTPGISNLLALNLGSAIPTVGTSLIVTFVDNRWVFRFDG